MLKSSEISDLVLTFPIQYIEMSPYLRAEIHWVNLSCTPIFLTLSGRGIMGSERVWKKLFHTWTICMVKDNI